MRASVKPEETYERQRQNGILRVCGPARDATTAGGESGGGLGAGTEEVTSNHQP